MLALMAAMRQEISPLLKAMTVESSTSDRSCRTYKGKYRGSDLLLVETGIGRRRAQHAARLALTTYPVKALVSFGFAGALDPSVRYGDVVVYDKVCCSQQGPDASATVGHLLPDPYLAEVASYAPARGGFKVVKAGGVSSPGVVCTSDAKRALGQKFSAGAVDMESYWVAEIAHGGNIPFLAVRAISDDVDEELPPFERFVGPEGWRKSAPFFASHPQELFRFWRLRRRMRQPAQNLTGVLDWMVDRVRI